MPSHEFDELKCLIEGIGTKVDNIAKSLKSCQSHCYVDNPPGRWKGLLRALTAFFRIG
jgi:hypothetical protein